MDLSRETAETIGLQAVAWLAGNDELLPVFLGATGASQEDFRTGLQDPEFQGAVLDFLLMDDAWVMAFCQAADLQPQEPMAARMALPGGASVHWT
ncbi:DUF3572 domain-containing protein [Mameliella sediminis]|uniref:DUF3572 domain-containing protein n=1 Tax=Mameliella sediminis TaxID=2836866 RepID=UPI001C494313|nr:DUF3572 domain-containing protein [Mameliella sediminis]MBY6112844.1 DUF3572 domain-containing protein [Antarctobacter heliothermus]MBY6143808.1 DUF3572 domain-containing protein [Mameliella alba]MBV7394126.1 DUF3572 domain-containing protein [Mameliella sediminis]MBY6162462.1 DUF3572 domain-containing protein [Mameliella alba]MBY6170936.1 DUF3572 domain-containing protein [Mameliella alba]